MIRNLMWSVIVAASWAGLALAADEKPAAKPQDPKAVTASVTLDKEKSAIAGHWAIVAKEIKLTEDQKAKLDAILKDRAALAAKFDEANSAKLKELEAAAKKAKEAKDEAATKAAAAELRKFKAQRDEAGGEVEPKLLPLLDAPQKAAYRAYTLYFASTIKFAKASLTDEQKKTVKSLAGESAKHVTDQTTEKELNKVKSDLYAKVTADVLTEAQRTALTAKPAPKKPADPK